MSEIVRVPFHGRDVAAVDIDGKAHVLFRPVVESMGLAYSSQLQRLKGRSWASSIVTSNTVAADGRTRQMVAVDTRTLTMWLATIDENKVDGSIRPLLVAYQKEVAEAIEAYWTKGGAINPRASREQLQDIAATAEAQARVLRALSGIVDSDWLEAKARHVAARALGEEPEIEFEKRPLTVGEYLEEKGVTGAALRKLSTGFGKKLKALYRERNGGKNPSTTERFVDGALRDVAGYTEAHRPLFDEVWSSPFGAAGAAI